MCEFLLEIVKAARRKARLDGERQIGTPHLDLPTRPENGALRSCVMPEIRKRRPETEARAARAN